MSRSSAPYDEVTKAILKKRKKHKPKSDFERHVEELRAFYKKKGPVVFALRFLRSPPLTPIHPKLGRIPEHIILSPEQVKYLWDRFKGIARYSILSAGRGGGKTLVKAIWNCWRIFCFDDYTINSMAGSQGQSAQIQKYINFWRRTVPEIGYELWRSVGGGPKEPPAVETRHYSTVNFLPCSETGSRSAHVNELDLDEVCSAEKAGKIEYMEAALWQVSTSPEVNISMASTAHWVFGMFLETWRDYQRLGYKRYSWAIAKHISGKPPEEIFRDKDPKHWIPNVWWVTQDFIGQLRKKSTDSNWLCECLGGTSIASGNVFSTDDLQSCVCDFCVKAGKECLPYKENHCIWADVKKEITERNAGADFGKSAPNGFVIAGRRGFQKIFILFAKEISGGTRDSDVRTEMEFYMRLYDTTVFIPDPANWSQGQAMEEKGFTYYEIEPDNEDRYFNAKRIVEQHMLIIPIVYQDLLKSIMNLVYDDRGNIVKINDHMADAFTYSVSQFVIGLAEMSKISNRTVDRLW